MVNKEFMKKKNELTKKYFDQVAGISEFNDVDLDVAFEMLLANARNRGKGYPLYEGCGEMDYDLFDVDVAALDALRRV